MKIVLVTEHTLAWDDLPARVAAIAAAVPDIAVQVRAKDLDGGAVLAMTRALIATGVEVWVNDRLDVALAAGAFGVHLPEHGLAVDDARALATLQVGCSRHSASAAIACGADLVQLGPIFDTPRKRPIGLEPLTAARAGFAGTLVAVGGIDSEDRASLAAAAGADAVAVIRAAWTGDAVATIRAIAVGVEAGRALR